VSHHTAQTPPALRRPARGAAAAVLAVAAALLTGCGSNDPASDSAPTSTSASSAASSSSAGESSASESSGVQSIAVTAVDFSFELDEDSFSPGTYEITLTNEGNATHDLVVERDGANVAQSEQIGPGESSTFEVTLEEGDYVFYCSIGNHRAMGMEVPVTVTA
jgi:plastocyanin